MKFLILLMLISCGKHEQPTALDLRDSDGDQIQDYQEGEFEKYIADYPRLEKVAGTMRFNTDKMNEVYFSNHSDLKEETLKLLAGDDSSLGRDQFFSEWSELKFSIDDKKFEVSTAKATIQLTFEPVEVKPDELVLVDGNTEKQLGSWTQNMRIELSKEEFNNLMKGKLQLALRKKFPKALFFLSDSDETIRNKTYKVHTYDGKKAKVLYVAKALPLEKLLQYLRINEITKVTDENLFFNSTDKGQAGWFQRNYPNGNKAFAFYPIQDLKTVFRKKFNQKNFKVERLNGAPAASLVLENKINSKIYMLVRPTATKRTFKEYTEVTHHRTGSASQGYDERWSCTHFKRKIETEVTLVPTIEDFLNNLNTKIELSKDFKVIEQFDEKGIFWEVMLTADVANLTLSLQGLNSSTFTTTGEHYVDCGYQGKRSTAATPTNFEGKLSFEIESFVEKFQ